MFLGAQGFSSQINQVARSQIFHNLKGQRGRSQHCGNAQGRGSNVAQRSCQNAQYGNESGSPSVSNASADNIGYRRAGNDQKHSGTGNKQKKRRMAEQNKRPLSLISLRTLTRAYVCSTPARSTCSRQRKKMGRYAHGWINQQRSLRRRRFARLKSLDIEMPT